MWKMLQNKNAEDFIIATGKQYSVRDFIEKAFEQVGIEIMWKGEGLEEVGLNKKNGKEIVVVDKKYYRPSEVESLLGDPSKAIEKLGWIPGKTTFNKLVEIMVKSDIELVKKNEKFINNYE